MKLSQVKEALSTLDKLQFRLPDGRRVPRHFHVTEVGQISKNFIDCGGTIRQEDAVSFQLWSSTDVDHRLAPEKLASIIRKSEEVLGMQDHEVEVEFQSDTIGRYGLEFDGKSFRLTTKKTDCLAKDNCGIPMEKTKVLMSELGNGACCGPEDICC